MSVAGFDVGNACSCVALARKRGVDVLMNKVRDVIQLLLKTRLRQKDAYIWNGMGHRGALLPTAATTSILSPRTIDTTGIGQLSFYYHPHYAGVEARDGISYCVRPEDAVFRGGRQLWARDEHEEHHCQHQAPSRQAVQRA